MSAAGRYISNDYGDSNPGWHVADSPWKAAQVLRALHGSAPRRVCEVGCGAGEILRQLHDRLPETTLVGYDIAPAAIEMALPRATSRLSFELIDAARDPSRFDVMLIMDVIEHVADPIGFLETLRFKADRTILHIPLDLSAQSVIRPNKLMHVRETVGHLHYFTPETAVATVEDAGYRVIESFYTRPFERPQQTTKSRIASVPRRLLPQAFGVRLLGGYSLLVVAENG